VIVVSHDRYFLDRICDQIIAFEENGVIVQPGNYSYYLEKRQAREAAERIQAQAAARDAAARQKSAASIIGPRNLFRVDLSRNEFRAPVGGLTPTPRRSDRPAHGRDE
jgi:ATPase subunit of ABC transporter with duplicated ATPase domains